MVILTLTSINKTYQYPKVLCSINVKNTLKQWQKYELVVPQKSLLVTRIVSCSLFYWNRQSSKLLIVDYKSSLFLNVKTYIFVSTRLCRKTILTCYDINNCHKSSMIPHPALAIGSHLFFFASVRQILLPTVLFFKMKLLLIEVQNELSSFSTLTLNVPGQL